MMYPTKLNEDYICRNLLSDNTQIPRELRGLGYQQLSLFDDIHFGGGSNVCIPM